MNAGQLSNTLSSLSKMMWRWENMKDALRKEVLTAVSKLCSSKSRATSNRDISVIINALGLFGLRWSHLRADAALHHVAQSISQGIHTVLRRGEREEVAGVIFGLGMMDVSWTNLTHAMRRDVIDGVRRSFGVNASTAAESFMKERYRTIRSSKGAGGLPALSAMSKEQALANTMYGISLLMFDAENKQLQDELNAAHIALLDDVAHLGFGTFNAVEKEQILIYLNVLETTASWETGVHDRCSKHFLLTAEKGKSATISRLQKTVVASVRGGICVVLMCLGDD